MVQLDLFDEKVKVDSGETEINYRPIKSSRATFLSGTKKSIHQWFRLTPSFGPDLVDIMLDRMDYKKGNIILDPFSGASTTLIQCRIRGIEAFGFEINPMLYFVGKTCLNWELKSSVLTEYTDQIVSQFNQNKERLKDVKTEDLGLRIPPIHNVHRWWRDDVLKELLILKNVIKNLNAEPKYIDFLLLSLSAVLVPDLTNVTLGKLQLHFIDRSKHTIDVLNTFLTHTLKVIDDVSIIETIPDHVYSELFHTDSTNISVNPSKKADLVITSPPYPNRYSYVWNTRPHLFFMDLFDNAKQASALDLKTIGGTWGTATSVLMKGVVEPVFDEIRDILLPVVNPIREQDNLMANYVMKYFNLLATQIVEMEKVVSANVKVAYVVGNSEIKGTYVATDELLGKMFDSLNLGYKTTELHRFRKRNSGVDLYETIVYAKK